MKRPILIWPDQRLMQASEPIYSRKGIQELLSDMEQAMDAAGGVGLAAPQVGVLKRVILVRISSGTTAMLNPAIVAAEQPPEKFLFKGEGCLSFPGVQLDVERYKHTIVDYYDMDWKLHTLDTRSLGPEGLLVSVEIQHEVDHLNGKTLADFMGPMKRDQVRRTLTKLRRVITKHEKD